MKEIWKEIQGYKGLYLISNYGIVMDSDGHIIRPGITETGFLQIDLFRDNRSVKAYHIHKLVADHFLSNPNNLPEVRHLDGNKKNNRLDNLEYTSEIKKPRKWIYLGKLRTW